VDNCFELCGVHNFFLQAAGNMFNSGKRVSALMNVPSCSYLAHECSGQCVEGYDYCIRHILEDKTAPYRLCGYVYSGNGRRCVMPTPKGDKWESGYVLLKQEVVTSCHSSSQIILIFSGNRFISE
jgi:hypothetical protein